MVNRVLWVDTSIKIHHPPFSTISMSPWLFSITCRLMSVVAVFFFNFFNIIAGCNFANNNLWQIIIASVTGANNNLWQIIIASVPGGACWESSCWSFLDEFDRCHDRGSLVWLGQVLRGMQKSLGKRWSRCSWSQRKRVSNKSLGVFLVTTSKHVCFHETRFQREHRVMNFNCPMRQWAKWVSESLKGASERSERSEAERCGASERSERCERTNVASDRVAR